MVFDTILPPSTPITLRENLHNLFFNTFYAALKRDLLILFAHTRSPRPLWKFYKLLRQKKHFSWFSTRPPSTPIILRENLHICFNTFLRRPEKGSTHFICSRGSRPWWKFYKLPRQEKNTHTFHGFLHTLPPLLSYSEKIYISFSTLSTPPWKGIHSFYLLTRAAHVLDGSF